MSSRIRLAAVLAAGALLLAGCAPAAATSDPTATGTPATELRLGYFANVTHGSALVGIQEGLFAKDLGATTLSTQVFNAGPATIEALSAGALDAAFLGPNPAINSFIQSGGQSLRVIAGATSGGAALVVREGITGPADLKGKNLATPQLGGTQDVALRSWLADNGLKTDTAGGGDVTITPTENATTLDLFKKGDLDGAWLPEPWASRLVLDAGAKVLVDEATLWPNGEFPTTILVVRNDFLTEHPQTVSALLQGHLDSLAWLQAHPDQAGATINKQIAADTGKPLSDAVIARALANVTFSPDPHAAAFQTLVDHGLTAGTQKAGSINGLFDLRLLNQELAAAGQPTVSAGGLGQDGS